ncbi:MAG TPA: GDSL-type esterase/lipase family protein, partial [Rubricoccaceae bacterium]
APLPSSPPQVALRFLALGDSYTIGEGVPEADRWPVQLAAALRAEGTAIADPEIVATTGWTVAELDAGIDEAGPRGPYALVTLLIGVNDQYRGGTVGDYRTAFRVMLGRAVGFAGDEAGRVVVVSIPDWGVAPFAAGRDRAQIAADLDAFNAAAQDEARAAGARWVDVSAVSRERGATDVVADGLHPSGALYAEWAALVLPEARTALAR